VVLTDPAWRPSSIDPEGSDVARTLLLDNPGMHPAVRRAADATGDVERYADMYDYAKRLRLVAEARERLRDLAQAGKLPVNPAGWRKMLAEARKQDNSDPLNLLDLDDIQNEVTSLVLDMARKGGVDTGQIVTKARDSLDAFEVLRDQARVANAKSRAETRARASLILRGRKSKEFVEQVAGQGPDLRSGQPIPLRDLRPVVLDVNDLEKIALPAGVTLARHGDDGYVLVRGDGEFLTVDEATEVTEKIDRAAVERALQASDDPETVLASLPPGVISREVARETIERAVAGLSGPEAYTQVVREILSIGVEAFEDTEIAAGVWGAAKDLVVAHVRALAPEIRNWEVPGALFDIAHERAPADLRVARLRDSMTPGDARRAFALVTAAPGRLSFDFAQRLGLSSVDTLVLYRLLAEMYARRAAALRDSDIGNEAALYHALPPSAKRLVGILRTDDAATARQLVLDAATAHLEGVAREETGFAGGVASGASLRLAQGIIALGRRYAAEAVDLSAVTPGVDAGIAAAKTIDIAWAAGRVEDAPPPAPYQLRDIIETAELPPSAQALPLDVWANL
jgi:hypothetical protein